MSTSPIEGENFVHFDKNLYEQQIHKAIKGILPQFHRAIKSYVIFNLFFWLLGTIEVLFLALFFTFFIQSSILAFSLALLFLTFFTYFILRLYFQTKKPEQLIHLRDRYVRACQKMIHFQADIPEHHMAVATACCRLAEALNGKEYSHYRPPSWLEALAPSLEKFSCWWLWHDYHKMKELLLQRSVEEHIEIVKCEPTNLEVHAALANAYVMLSGLYIDPRKIGSHDEDHWIPPQRFSKILQEKFRWTAERAIEEFKILNDYAPNDTWVHSQLAYSYHDLQMPEEEIREYETILKLRPDDQDTLFKLGVLYFQQGQNAKGLRLYDKLKHSHYKKAENLIKFYGAHSPVSAYTHRE